MVNQEGRYFAGKITFELGRAACREVVKSSYTLSTLSEVRFSELRFLKAVHTVGYIYFSGYMDHVFNLRKITFQ